MTGADALTPEASAELAGAGLLREIAGWRVVHGFGQDPLSGRSSLFLRWVPPELACRQDDLDAVVRDLLGQHAVDEVILRLPHDLSAPHGWRRRELYLRWEGAAPDAHGPLDGIAVREAQPSDGAFVADLLTRALRDAYAEDGADLDEDATMRYVTADILGAPGAGPRSWVARDATGRRTGHITVLEDADDLTGAPFLECLDMFVLEGDRAGPSSRLLVGAAAAYAAQRRLPLYGHVICSAGWEQIAAHLRARGWTDDHSLWVRPATSTPVEVPR